MMKIIVEKKTYTNTTLTPLADFYATRAARAAVIAVLPGRPDLPTLFQPSNMGWVHTRTKAVKEHGTHRPGKYPEMPGINLSFLYNQSRTTPPPPRRHRSLDDDVARARAETPQTSLYRLASCACIISYNLLHVFRH